VLCCDASFAIFSPVFVPQRVRLCITVADRWSLMNTWRSALLQMNTLLRLEARTPPVFILSRLIIDLPGLLDLPTIEVYVDQECVYESTGEYGVAWDSNILVADVSLFVCGDVQVRCRHWPSLMDLRPF
jgi:hypothetical protein